MPDTLTPIVPSAGAVAAERHDGPGHGGLFGLAIGVVVVASLYLAREVLIPITLAALLSFVLAPLVRLLRQVRFVGRVASVLVAMLVALGVLVMLGGVIGTQVASLAGNMANYRTTIEHKVGTVQGAATRGMAYMLRNYARGLQGVNATSAAAPISDPVTGKPEVKPVPVQVLTASPSAFSLAETVLAPVVGPLATIGIIFVVAIFLLLQQEDLRDRMIRLFGSGDLHRTTLAIDDAAKRLSRYFLTQLGINTVFGVVIGGGLALIGVPSPVLWGVIATLLRFVPYVGSFIAAVLPVALAAAVDPGWSMMIYTIALFGVVETVVGQAVEPMMYGSSTGLSPFSVIVAAIFWSWLWGPIGLILSTPITLCLVVLGRHVQRLEFLDVLLGDRPALSPVESFYQRMLAGDPDEAQAHAELLLRDRALSSYYDEVVLKGMLMATTDAERGVLSPEKLSTIAGAMVGLMEELDEYPDEEPGEPARSEAAADETLMERRLPRHPPPATMLAETAELPLIWRGEQPVLCVAGRGPLDETAARMLAQLLGKHGIGARVATHDAASRAQVASLDMRGVAMVCVTYLSIEGAPSHLRYLVGRLRRRLPATPLLVGMWADDDPVRTEPGLRAAIGADSYASTLREAVQACLDASRPVMAGTQAA